MDKFPSEILCDIFQKSLPYGRGYDLPYSASVSAPLDISHVCRSWREIALSYGELWSQLYICFPTEEGPSKWRVCITIFDTWLSRTKGSPLNFAFHFNFFGLDDEVDAHRGAEYIITTLLSQQHRWRDVNFFWCDLRTSAEFPGINVISMPMLTSLSLVAFDFKTANDEQITAIINIAHSSRLESLDLHGSYLLETGNEPIRTLSSSTLGFSFNSHGDNAARSCINFLKVASYLTEFGLYSEGILSLQPSEWPFRLLPNLRTLDLLNGPPPTCSVDRLTLPSLEVLRYENESDVRGDESLVNFVQRSHPPLIFLEINSIPGGDFSDDSLIVILRSLPTLKELRFASSNFSTRIFLELTVTSSANINECTSCAALQSLHLFWLDSTTCMEALIIMLKSRWEILKTFRTATFIPNTSGSDPLEFEISDIERHAERLQKSLQGFELTVKGDHVPPYPFSN